MLQLLPLARRTRSDPSNAEPVRSELFSLERFDEHARSLAAAQKVAEDHRFGNLLAPRLRENGRRLREAYRYLKQAIDEDRSITPAAEWLVDSFHVVDEQLREIRRDLPRGFYGELPKLADGFLAGYPRIYGVAWAYVAHTDSRFDPEILRRFVETYQETQPLTIGELWALAITLRVVMIENLRRLSLRVVNGLEARRQADSVADRILGILETEKTKLSYTDLGRVADRSAYLVQLLQRLRYHDPERTPAVKWLHETLAADGKTDDGLASEIHRRLGEDNITVRNIITGFRAMTAFDWPKFFESVSLVHRAFAENSRFMEMDFATRDQYRHSVEDLARISKQDELAVARRAIEKSKTTQTPSAAFVRDPGYFLVGGGRTAFAEELGASPKFRDRLRGIYLSRALFFYFGSFAALTALLLAIPFSLGPSWVLLLAIIPASELALALVNRWVTEAFGPKRLASLELRDGPTAELRTLIVVPTMLTRLDEIHSQMEKLEVHYLANADGDTFFALATDWSDASSETKKTDEVLLAAARAEIEILNRRHGPAADGHPRFHLFHRRRLWNAQEGKWMGWERKRGKLEEMNHLLRGGTSTSFIPAPEGPPPGIRYVITLDADTRLPKGAVNNLVGTIAHPLNQARIDPKLRKVVEGYGILQPRITASLPNREERSIYQRLFSGECGIDPYASAVSDVYQDLFGEGSYTGKGIYDLNAFDAVLRDRIPENALLSHDLFEGTFARCGFASTIEFFEDFPSHVEVADSRNHRWIRGDWQLLPWIFGREGEAISPLARWKMIENLRRSLVYPSTLALLLAAVFAPAAATVPWILFALAPIALPPLLPLFSGLIPRSRSLGWIDYSRDMIRDGSLGVGHFLVTFFLLPHRAIAQVDAIVRAVWRLTISHRKMLEWVTAAQAKSQASLSALAFWRRMAPAALLGVGTVVLAIVFHPRAEAAGITFGLLWFVSPAFSRLISQAYGGDEVAPLDATERAEMRLHARKIWRFFTTFVTDEDHHLPPDNFQEDPDPVVAHRSSPTNFGLYLLSAIAARDFGWSGMRELCQRLELTLESMQKLPRFRGHFYNWYETKEFRTLDPKYISSVDSGNLAGHLIVLSQSCAELKHSPLLTTTTIDGMTDTLTLLKKAAELISEDHRSVSVPLAHLLESISRFQERLALFPKSPLERAEYWDALVFRAEGLRDIATAYVREASDPTQTDLVAWAEILHSNAKSHASDFRELFPWASLLSRLRQVERRSPSDEVHFTEIERLLALDLSLLDCPRKCEEAIAHCESLRSVAGAPRSPISDVYFDTLIDALERSAEACRATSIRLDEIAAAARTLFNEMEFGFLFNEKKKLFSIGYRVAEDQLDESCYDLLASESRLASYVAIIKGDVPVSHWFRLGRGLVPVKGGAALISWSGSMFEYLMPSLVMIEPHGSLLEETCQLAVGRQIEYGEQRGVPWGISESAFNVRDLALTYQYSNFGVPGLGLKRGLDKDLVIAPYATALAAMYEPRAAAANLRRIVSEGGAGSYGFYESMDYTPSRLQRRENIAIVRAYMAHHQGMALLSFSNVIHHGQMRKRFHSDPLVQAAELLLQERTPRHMGELRRVLEEPEAINVRETIEPTLRKFRSPHHSIPSSHILSNERYSVMITAAGSGYSRWKNLAVTRWREDVTRDATGNYLYLRDVESGKFWSPTYQPAGVDPDHSEIVFAEHEAHISRVDGTIQSDLEILVSVEDDVELRRLTLTNRGTTPREIEITSYAEAVIAPPDADRAHPAFSNLFVQTEFVPEHSTLLATRRPRSANESRVYMGQVLFVEGEAAEGIEYETDRAKFVGRGRTLRRPIALIDRHPLSNTVGAVLDPILSMRVRVTIPPGATVKACYTTLATSSREDALVLSEKYRHPNAFDRASTLTWVHSLAKLHHLGIEPDEAQLFQRLAGRIVHSDPLMRPATEVFVRNRLNVTGLWGRGISGDLPILVARVDEMEDIAFIRQLVRAHEFWRTKRLAVDIVILNEKGSSYVQDFQTSLEGMARSAEANRADDIPLGKIFVLRNDLLDTREKDLLLSYARVILNSRAGTLAEQVGRVRKPNPLHVPAPAEAAAPLTDGGRVHSKATKAADDEPSGLEFFNGLGGFARDGKEYVIVLRKGQRTPAPWLNVVSNGIFGFQVSESGSGYTWSVNSRENQLTPWSNDPIVDPPSEAIYLRDLDSGAIWTPTANPIRKDDATYIIRHGMGYSRFETQWNDIRSELSLFIAEREPVKFSRLSLTNTSGTERKISITGYAEWVLGFTRGRTAPYVLTEVDPETGAIFAWNPIDPEFGGRVAFFDLRGRQTASTSDRAEFLGRNGSFDRPAALLRAEGLSGTHGGGLDPATVLQTEITLEPHGEAEVTFVLGQADSRDEARRLIRKFRAEDPEAERVRTDHQWAEMLGKLQVRTPDRAMDLLLNGWLLYQTLACRFWARAAFYQAGGAYGFRDQLQDTLALASPAPKLTREHILRAAARQFLEGDVQHWWHPPRGRGVRTHFSDDLLWLPYVVHHYLEVTGDLSILEERVSFIEGPELRPDQEDSYYQPRSAPESQSATLFEHCARAIDRSLAVGTHGLPLIGSGDWNDGMNRVGHAGKGESVWVGWFLLSVLDRFVPLANARKDQTSRATTWRAHSASLKAAIEGEAWDGEWYRRAYFDDGTPLGSSSSEECKIDSIAQTWAVLSGAADPVRARTAMASVGKHLVRAKERQILLFTPPFDKTATDPGYIKGYLPGVRENGGQYTHAAVWVVCAEARLGNGDRAHELFSMLNPVLQAANRTGVQTYKVEPYVLAADVYGVAPHTGRGGWTWYTGSSGWMYRAGMEYLLGIRIRGDRLHVEPNIPKEWPGFSATYRHGAGIYEIKVINASKRGNGVTQVELDGVEVSVDAGVPLLESAKTHRVRITLG
jgi:cyclic beta-1,2-glucan synthetase